MLTHVIDKLIVKSILYESQLVVYIRSLEKYIKFSLEKYYKE